MFAGFENARDPIGFRQQGGVDDRETKAGAKSGTYIKKMMVMVRNLWLEISTIANLNNSFFLYEKYTIFTIKKFDITKEENRINHHLKAGFRQAA